MVSATVPKCLPHPCRTSGERARPFAKIPLELSTPAIRGHALSALIALAPDLGTDSDRSGTSLHEHRSSGRRARPGTSPGFGVAAAVATPATAAAFPTSPRPALAAGQHQARPTVRQPNPSSASAQALDDLRPRSKEVSR